MNQSKSFTLLAGSLLLIAAALFFLNPGIVHSPGDERLAALEARLDQVPVGSEDMQASLFALIGRIDDLENRLDRRPRSDLQPATQSQASTEPSGKVPSTSTNLPKQDFRRLMAKVVRVSMEGSASPEEQQAFWETARNTNVVDDAIDELEARVQANERDDDARMDLADAYVTKLLTVPAGPERGIWGVRAEAEWQAVIDNNPDHWDAQYTLAYNYSMYPDFVSKTEEAVAGFENALAIQERNTPTPEHSQTYVQLARLYEKQGKTAEARKLLEQGSVRHPGDPGIMKALQKSK